MRCDSGEQDSSRAARQQLSAIFQAQAVAHTCDAHASGGHDWGAWQEMLPLYLGRIPG